MFNQARRRPPYGAKATPYRGEYLVLYGNPAGWEHTEACHQYGLNHTLLLPLGERASSYRWPVASLSVVTVNGGYCDANESLELTETLLRAGARYVVDCSPHIEPQPRFYRLETEKAA